MLQEDFSSAKKFFDLGVSHRGWERVCQKKVPSKVQFFLWILARKKTLTMENLKNMGFKLASHCPFHMSEEENIEHLFFSGVNF